MTFSTLCGSRNEQKVKVNSMINTHTLKNGLVIRLFENIKSIADEWDTAVPQESFFQSDFLDVLERTNPDNLSNLYVRIEKNGSIKAYLLLQITVLKIKDSFNYEQYTTDRSFLSLTWQRFRQKFLSLLTFRMATIGNLYLTGNYGVVSTIESDGQEAFRMAKYVVSELKKILRSTPYRFDGQLYKDFFMPHAGHTSSKDLVGFCIDPNMILAIDPTWTSFDDYLLDMRSKYRVRMKSALKKSKGVHKSAMLMEDVEAHYLVMYELYSSLLGGAGFVLAKANENYFLELKRALGDALQVTGYWLDGKLIGFYTWVMEGDKMDTHFIGFSQELNNRYQLYLNILLDLVKDGIGAGAKFIYFFRTALEIKSSVGAVPHDMVCYFKHNNALINTLLIKNFFKSFVPKQQWTLRQPFKKDVADEE